MKTIVLIILMAIPITSSSQVKDTVICEGLKPVNIRSTLSGYEFSELINIDREDIINGFRIRLSDISYKIISFRAVCLANNCDIYYKDIFGDQVTKDNYPILNHVTGGLIEIVCVTVSKDKKVYSAKPFSFFF